MIYKKLQATFGRLENEELELREGLNIITCGNESGKSTWAEFLLAMLYGVDSRSRGKAGELPVKTKYAPWSGKPMEGRLELEQDGRRLFISNSRSPPAIRFSSSCSCCFCRMRAESSDSRSC